MTPTQRTQKYLRQLGYIVANCERKMPCTPKGFRGPLITQDLFGFIDTMAVKASKLLAVQTTSGVHHADHKRKVLAAPAFPLLSQHMDIQVWSWAKRGARGKRKLWHVKIEAMPRHTKD